jgi:hypothetical protein
MSLVSMPQIGSAEVGISHSGLRSPGRFLIDTVAIRNQRNVLIIKDRAHV